MEAKVVGGGDGLLLLSAESIKKERLEGTRNSRIYSHLPTQ